MIAKYSQKFYFQDFYPNEKMSEQKLMKDALGEAAILRIQKAFKKSYPQFYELGFHQSAMNGIESLELKERVNKLIFDLHEFLPKDFRKTAEVLLAVKDHWDYGDPEDNMKGFVAH